jgi:hypothetical protein
MIKNIPEFEVYWLRFFPFIWFYKINGKLVRGRTYWRKWQERLNKEKEGERN